MVASKWSQDGPVKEVLVASSIYFKIRIWGSFELGAPNYRREKVAKVGCILIKYIKVNQVR